jgi:farnesyl-diphosphate farnesyltransferase
MNQNAPGLLTDTLKSVSRSFYLSLRVLPEPLRSPVSLAYLLARAADTIADTEIVPRERRIQFLGAFREELAGEPPRLQPFHDIRKALGDHQNLPAERILLQRLPEAVGAYAAVPTDDRLRLRFVLSGLIHGMLEDLEYFPGNSPEEMRAFDSLEDLDRYVYHAAGIVGEFWTDISCAHVPALRHWNVESMKAQGVRFGKGLQLVNVLRDTPRDLRNGRCYFPQTLLRMVGLSAPDLLQPASQTRFRPLLNHVLQMALDHFDAARDYVLAIPRRQVRLRLACIWPLWIGLKTLSGLVDSERLLDPEVTVRISRPQLYQLIRQSLASVWSNALVKGYTIAFRHEVEKSLHRR